MRDKITHPPVDMRENLKEHMSVLGEIKKGCRSPKLELWQAGKKALQKEQR